MLMTFVFLGTAALFAVGACVAGWHPRWMRRLPSLEAVSDGGACSARGPVGCSVIVAARDEEARIGETVRRLLAQTGLELELAVVDDRSWDRTGEILERLSKEDARLSVLRIDRLPEGPCGRVTFDGAGPCIPSRLFGQEAYGRCARDFQ